MLSLARPRRAYFAGWHRRGRALRSVDDQRRDEPLSSALRGRGSARRGLRARTAFDAAFCEFGLPLAIRSDNGPPFASVGAGGLSRLSRVVGSSSACGPSGSIPASRSRTAGTSGMHRTLKRRPPNRRRRRPPSSSGASTRSAPSTMTSGRTRPWTSPRRPRALSRLAARLSRASCASPAIRPRPRGAPRALERRASNGPATSSSSARR